MILTAAESECGKLFCLQQQPRTPSAKTTNEAKRKRSTGLVDEGESEGKEIKGEQTRGEINEEPVCGGRYSWGIGEIDDGWVPL